MTMVMIGRYAGSLERMRLVLLHYHILKNGGSSIIEILRRSYPENFAEYDRPDKDAEILPPDVIAFLAANPRIHALSSHQIYYPAPGAPGFLFYDICFLRDPLDRIRSIYDYFRGRPIDGDPIRQMANECTLGDFVRRLMEEMPWTVNDVQVNLLANGMINDQPRGPEDLEIATRRMLDTSFLGVVDLFDESLVAGQHGLSSVFPGLNCVQAPVNDSAAQGSTLSARLENLESACDPCVYAEIVRLNAMDFELLRRARAEVMRRFALVPDREARLKGLKEGVAILKARGDPEPPATTPRPEAAKIGRPVLWKRWWRFASNLRASRPGSTYRRLIDAEFYLRQYPDVGAAGMSPLRHYVLHGASEGRKPNALFQPEYYATVCEAARGVDDPLMHFADSDPRACASPHPLFDCEGWRRANPGARGNPLAEYLEHMRGRVSIKRQTAPECDLARIEVQDVEILIVFPGSQFDSQPADERDRTFRELRASSACEVALVWLDGCGETKFLCAPQLERFFHSARYDQLAAQLSARSLVA